MDEIRFSVLLSVYKGEKGIFLDEALQSLLDQTCLPAEIVVVKDGPLTEELDRVIDRYTYAYPELFRVVPLARNVGLGKALNEGLKRCTYDLVARMDSDDICVPDRFEKQVALFRRYPDADAVGGWIREFSVAPSEPGKVRRVEETPARIRRISKWKSPMNHVTVMFRKQRVQEAGGYLHFYLLEDYYLWARMLRNGCVFYNCPECLVRVRGGDAMSARRGGWKYAVSEVKFQRTLLRMHFVNGWEFLRNVAVRFPVRLVSPRFRLFLYNTFLRG